MNTKLVKELIEQREAEISNRKKQEEIIRNARSAELYATLVPRAKETFSKTQFFEIVGKPHLNEWAWEVFERSGGQFCHVRPVDHHEFSSRELMPFGVSIVFGMELKIKVESDKRPPYEQTGFCISSTDNTTLEPWGLCLDVFHENTDDRWAIKFRLLSKAREEAKAAFLFDLNNWLNATNDCMTSRRVEDYLIKVEEAEEKIQWYFDGDELKEIRGQIKSAREMVEKLKKYEAEKEAEATAARDEWKRLEESTLQKLEDYDKALEKWKSDLSDHGEQIVLGNPQFQSPITIYEIQYSVGAEEETWVEEDYATSLPDEKGWHNALVNFELQRTCRPNICGIIQFMATHERKNAASRKAFKEVKHAGGVSVQSIRFDWVNEYEAQMAEIDTPRPQMKDFFTKEEDEWWEANKHFHQAYNDYF